MHISLTLALGALGAALAVGTAQAGSLRVSPVLFEVSQARPTATLTLQNQGDAPMIVQVRVFLWRNGPTGDVLTPTTDVAASPPFATVAAGAEQTVRLVRVAPGPPVDEQAYRVLVDELPNPDRSDGHLVTLLMRHSMPLFVEGNGLRRPDVAWAVSADASGYHLTAANHGARRERIADVRLYDAAGALLAEQGGLLGYVLGGSGSDWRLSLKTGGAPSRLSIETDLGHQDVTVSRAAP
jgi:fimbrial chaperone protein